MQDGGPVVDDVDKAHEHGLTYEDVILDELVAEEQEAKDGVDVDHNQRQDGLQSEEQGGQQRDNDRGRRESSERKGRDNVESRGAHREDDGGAILGDRRNDVLELLAPRSDVKEVEGKEERRYEHATHGKDEVCD